MSPRKKTSTKLGETKTVSEDEIRKAAEASARAQTAQADEPPLLIPDQVMGEDVTEALRAMLRTFRLYARTTPNPKKTEQRLIQATIRRLQKTLSGGV